MQNVEESKSERSSSRALLDSDSDRGPHELDLSSSNAKFETTLCPTFQRYI